MKEKNVILIAVIIVVLSVAFVVWFRPGYHYSYDKNQFLDNEQSYTEIARLFLEHRALHDKDIIGNIVGAGVVDEFTLYCSECNTKFNVNVTESGKAVRHSFYLAKQGLDGIYTSDNFVSFGIVTGVASFIYSENGEKPTFVNKPNGQSETKKPYIEKITDNWYYACK